jgi:hypothetical protein
VFVPFRFRSHVFAFVGISVERIRVGARNEAENVRFSKFLLHYLHCDWCASPPVGDKTVTVISHYVWYSQVGQISEHRSPSGCIHGHAVAQAVSRWIPTAAARVRAQVRSCGICGGQSGTGIGFLRVLRVSFPKFYRLLHTHHHPLSRTCTIGRRLTEEPSGLSLTSPQGTKKVVTYTFCTTYVLLLPYCSLFM